MFESARVACALVVLTACSLSSAWAETQGEILTWSALVRLSGENDPAVSAAQAAVVVAQRELTAAKVNPNPMSLNASAGPRVDVSGSVSGEANLGIGHTIELGDKARLRSAVATARIEQARATVAEARRAAVLRAAIPWSRLIAARTLETALTRQVALAVRLVDVTRRRVAGGAGTKAELHAASLMHIEAKGALARARGEGKAWAHLLQKQLQLRTPPTVSETATAPAVPPLAEMLSNLPKRRGEAIRLGAAAEEARSRAALSSAMGKGDLTLGGYVGVEGPEILFGLTLQIPLSTSDRPQLDARVAEAKAGVLDLERNAALGRVSERLTHVWWQWDGHHRRAKQMRAESAPAIADTLTTTRSLIAQGEGTTIEHITVLQRVASLEQATLEADLEAREAAIVALAVGGAL